MKFTASVLGAVLLSQPVATFVPFAKIRSNSFRLNAMDGDVPDVVKAYKKVKATASISYIPLRHHSAVFKGLAVLTRVHMCCYKTHMFDYEDHVVLSTTYVGRNANLFDLETE